MGRSGQSGAGTGALAPTCMSETAIIQTSGASTTSDSSINATVGHQAFAAASRPAPPSAERDLHKRNRKLRQKKYNCHS